MQPSNGGPRVRLAWAPFLLAALATRASPAQETATSRPVLLPDPTNFLRVFRFPGTPSAPLNVPLPLSKAAVPASPQGGGALSNSSPSATDHPSRDTDAAGSTFVPMDSWVYPALERLSTMGLIPSQSVSIRPWTRQECRRQLREAQDILFGFGSLDYDVTDSIRAEARRMLPELEQELREPDGKATATLEAVYARAGVIAGPALTDGFHFGQTWWNDYGRPLGRGATGIVGYSLRATSGRFFFHTRQELQTDPGLPALTPGLADLFNQIDNVPFLIPSQPVIPAQVLFTPSPARAAYVRARPLDLYAGVAFAGNAVSFGKQELFWGPTTMGPWAFSRNAEPTYNLRVVSTRPHPFPFVPELGSYRFDVVFGKLSGHSRPSRPYFNGQKIELTFGHYLEASFTRWSVLWGVGHPMTLRSLKDNLFSSNSTGTNFAYGDRADPGDRKSGFDFRLHPPGFSNLLTLYADGYADDEVNPLDAPRRVPWQTGVYLARFPGLPRLDVRFEMASSRELSRDEGGARIYLNNQYRDANTNKGFLLGNAVGRDARAFEGRVGYWQSPRTRLEFGYRQNRISALYLPGGGTVSDAFLESSYTWRRDWSVQGFAQLERFLVPSSTPGRQTNGSARLQITWSPQRSVRLEP